MSEPIRLDDDLYWNENPTLYCRGHLDPLVFIGAADPKYNLTPKDARFVKHYWIRKVPDSTGEYSMRWVVEEGPGPGVSPYTILES